MGNKERYLTAAHIQKFASEYFKRNATFILGVSGGPDSMALLYLFHKAGLNGTVVHVNYQKRGEESELDQELSEEMAFAWGFDCISVRLDPEDAAGENFQNWARDERYKIFRDLMRENNADAIVTAHHQDDQVETILQKLLRGSSPAAWQGMKHWDGEIFRPLLEFSKEEILEFCKKEAVPFRMDASNLETGFARNFIRHEFSEKLDAFFPGWKQNILGLQEYGELFEDNIAFIVDQVYSDSRIKMKDYKKLPVKVRSAVMKKIMDDMKIPVSYSKGQLQQLANLGEFQTGRSIKIPPFLFFRERDEIVVQLQQDESAQKEISIEKTEAEQGLNIGSYFLKISDENIAGELSVDAAKLEWPLVLRPWQKGDAFQPLGMRGRQKISDHLTNRKISSYMKEKALVLCGADSTIYAIIYPEPALNGEKYAIAGLAKLDDSTTNILTITIE